MSTIETTIVINRPIDEVFVFATDLDKFATWQTGLVESTQTSEGPLGAGSTYRWVTQFLGRRIETVGEITEYEPNRKMCFKSTSGPFPFGGCQRFEPTNGGTRLTLIMHLEPGGFFRLAEPLMLRMAERSTMADYQNLKDLLEAEAEDHIS